MPAPVPLKPLTDATDSLVKRSEGKTFAIVVKQAYENVDSPKRSVIANKFTVKLLAMIVPQVWGSFNRSLQRGRGFEDVPSSWLSARIIWSSVLLMRG